MIALPRQHLLGVGTKHVVWLARLAGRCGMVSALRRLPDGQQHHLPTLGPQRAGLDLEPPTSRAGSQLWAKPGLVQPGSNQAGTSSAPLPFLVFYKAYLGDGLEGMAVGGPHDVILNAPPDQQETQC